jgi:hypothetical protein
MATKKWSVSELLRLACIYAEQDRMAMAEADGGEYGQEAKQLALAIRKYRIKRWGTTALEEDLKNTTSIDIKDIIGKNR